MRTAPASSPRTGAQRYKHAAELALKIIGRPATIGEIVDCIVQEKSLRGSLAGRTPQKTIQARIATDIRELGPNSKFYRFAPGTFGLRELAEQGLYESGYRRIYVGHDRKRQVDQTPVMCLIKEEVKLKLHNKILPADVVPIRYLRNLSHIFVARSNIDTNIHSEIRLFIVIRHNNFVICYTPTDYDENLFDSAHHQNIGISGSIHQNDLDLFDSSGIGLENANLREIKNFFYFLPDDLTRSVESITYLGLVSNQISPQRQSQIGIVSQVSIKQELALSSSVLGITNLEWRSLKHIPNSFGHMDPWSQYTFRLLHEQLQSENL